MREWWKRVTRLGAHSRRMATFSVWEILLSSPVGDTGYIPRPVGRHRPEQVRPVWRGHRLRAETVLRLWPPSRVDWVLL